jgi:hypothetical protein
VRCYNATLGFRLVKDAHLGYLGRILRVAWERWQIIAHVNGDYIARLVVNLFYFTIMIPFALGVKYLTDPLSLRKNASSQWLPRKPVGAKLDEARGQF